MELLIYSSRCRTVHPKHTGKAHQGDACFSRKEDDEAGGDDTEEECAVEQAGTNPAPSRGSLERTGTTATIREEARVARDFSLEVLCTPEGYMKERQHISA